MCASEPLVAVNVSEYVFGKVVICDCRLMVKVVPFEVTLICWLALVIETPVGRPLSCQFIRPVNPLVDVIPISNPVA